MVGINFTQKRDAKRDQHFGTPAHLFASARDRGGCDHRRRPATTAPAAHTPGRAHGHALPLVVAHGPHPRSHARCLGGVQPLVHQPVPDRDAGRAVALQITTACSRLHFCVSSVYGLANETV